MTRKPIAFRPPRRRGAVIIQAALCLTVMAGFAALAIDVGQLCAIRADLQNTADAAALAGASAYFSDVGLAQDPQELKGYLGARAASFALQNKSFGAGGTVLDIADVTIATHDFDNPHAPLDTSGAPRFNAVEVTVRRAPGSSNPSVLFFFAGFLGMKEGSVSATATAAIDDRVAGVEYDPTGPTLIPFTIYKPSYDYMLGNGDDDYSYDDEVLSRADGVKEVHLFPWRLKPKKNDDNNVVTYFELDDGSGGGNFGLLSFEGGSASTVTEQIHDGISAAALEAQLGTSNPRYFDEDGNPITYTTIGESGMESKNKDALNSRKGEIVGFFLHDSASGSGSHVEYRNVGIRYGRIMDIQMGGGAAHSQLVVQPVAVDPTNLIMDEDAESTEGQLGRVLLVR